MQFDTFLFGKIDIAPEAILTFPHGMPGFEDCKRYTLIHEQHDKSPSSFTLQSLDDAAVAFQIVDPTAYGFHYELNLNEEESALLQMQNPTDIAVMLVLFRRNDQRSPIEANFGAPLLINTQARLGMQKVLERQRTNVTLSNISHNID